MGLFDKFKQGLKKTTQLLKTDVRDIFKTGEILDEAKLGRFESRLVQADLGVKAADEIVTELRKQFLGRTVVDEAVWTIVKDKLKAILKGTGGPTWNASDPLSPLKQSATGTTVILVAGVNGAGKTTSISKLAKLLQSANKKVLLAAGDTFRAAAVEQLTMWSKRLGCGIVTQPSGSDPASVAHIGCERALAEKCDVLIIDTAGRLQTQRNLMDELAKIRRVVGKKIPDGPHEVPTRPRRDDGSERPEPGPQLLRNGRLHGDHPRQARRHGQGGRDRSHPPADGHPGQVRRRRREDRRH